MLHHFLNNVRTALPGFPLDPLIIQVLLITIIAGDKHLILRTSNDDIALVAKLTSLALSTVFGYHTHKAKCHPNTAPSECLRTLFFTVDNNINKHRQRRVSNSRNSAVKIAPSTSVSTARSRKTSISHPIESKHSTTTLGRPHSDSDYPDRKTSSIPGANSPRPSLHPAGAQTDTSVPTLASITKSHFKHSSTDVLKLPSVVVVSGLEFASLPCQKAILRTLAERKIIVSDEGIFGHDHDGTTFQLPDGFFIVYVCQSDPRERPPIYKSLLDRFAMSSSVDISPQTRLALRQFRPPSSPSATSPYTCATSAAFPTAHLSSSFPDPPTPSQPMTAPVIPSALVRRLKYLCATQARIRPPLNIYLADLFSATRHYGPLDAMMLTVRARHDAEALIRASRVLGIDPTGAELIREHAQRPHETDSVSTYPHTYTSVAGASTEGLLDGTDVLETYELLGNSNPTEPLHLDVSEADIARIFPRVVSHRIRVRDSPLDEILSSAVGGAISAPGNELHEDEWERETVKDILVHILAEV